MVGGAVVEMVHGEWGVAPQPACPIRIPAEIVITQPRAAKPRKVRHRSVSIRFYSFLSVSIVSNPFLSFSPVFICFYLFLSVSIRFYLFLSVSICCYPFVSGFIRFYLFFWFLSFSICFFCFYLFLSFSIAGDIQWYLLYLEYCVIWAFLSVSIRF